MHSRQQTSTGPRSRRGKARASTNATRHGLTGTALVLPGETVEAYTANQEVWFAALDPKNGAEAQLVGQIADVAWRLDRCTRIEHERLRAQIGHEMTTTSAWRSVSALKSCLDALRGMMRTLEFEAQKGEHVRTLSDVFDLLAPSRRVIKIVRDANGATEEALLAQEAALSELERRANTDGVTISDLAAVFHAAKGIAEQVEQALHTSMAAMDELTKRIASLTIPGENDTKKMARYRAELERSQARLLDLLEEVRGASRGRRRKNGSSFRDGNSAPVFRLRVIR